MGRQIGSQLFDYCDTRIPIFFKVATRRCATAVDLHAKAAFKKVRTHCLICAFKRRDGLGITKHRKLLAHHTCSANIIEHPAKLVLQVLGHNREHIKVIRQSHVNGPLATHASN